MNNFTKLNIKSFDNKEICTYISNNNSDKAIIICHGMAETITRYEYFANRLVNAGYKVLAYAQRGHYPTDSEADLGYIAGDKEFKLLLKDLDYLVDYLKFNFDTKVSLFGHSMGSFIVTRYAETHNAKVEKIVICGTGRNPNFVLSLGIFIGGIEKLFRGPKHRSRLLNNMSFGSFNKKFKPNRTAYDWLTTDHEIVDKYIEDPYCGNIMSASFYIGLFRCCKYVNKHLKRIPTNLPILLISGKEDPVGNMGKAPKIIYDKLSKKNKNVEIEIYEKARHEILNEPIRDDVIINILDFLNK